MSLVLKSHTKKEPQQMVVLRSNPQNSSSNMCQKTKEPRVFSQTAQLLSSECSCVGQRTELTRNFWGETGSNLALWLFCMSFLNEAASRPRNKCTPCNVVPYGESGAA
jgi:hypothetical protein